VPAEHGLRDEVEDELLRRVVDHRDLLQHDLALRIEVGEGGREDHVRHHVERRFEVLVEHPGVHDGVVAAVAAFARRRRVVSRSRLRSRAVPSKRIAREVADAGVRALVPRAGVHTIATERWRQRLGHDRVPPSRGRR
jgi:hypothetical protein